MSSDMEIYTVLINQYMYIFGIKVKDQLDFSISLDFIILDTWRC